MTRIQSILVGVDLAHGDRLAAFELGAESQAAISEALGLAQALGATVTFCTVLELSAQTQTLIQMDYENLVRSVEDIARDALTGLVSRATELRLAAESCLRFGSAWEELSKEAASGDYDLVVIGTHTRAAVTRLLFGSTAQKLLRYAPCPVWVVKPAELREIREIAVASDLSPAVSPAMHAAVMFARAMGARMHVIHSLELEPLRFMRVGGASSAEMAATEERIRQAAEKQLQEQLFQTDFRTILHGTKIEILSGHADSSIPAYVVEQKIDLLVIGTHGRRGITGITIGNTAERILPNLHASLLAVKPTDFRSPFQRTAAE